MDIRGKVITGDALYANANLCASIVEQGGDYAFTLKSNQQSLRHDMLQIFRLNPWKDHPAVVRRYEEEISKAHGRMEMRKIEVMSNPYTHYGDGFRTIRQIARITRYRHVIGTEPHENEASVSYMITSLEAGETTAKELLTLNRSHWAIENLLHRHRDVLYAEDKGTLRTKEAPQVNAALNNIGLQLLSQFRKTSKPYRSLSLKHLAGALSRKLSIPVKMLS